MTVAGALLLPRDVVVARGPDAASYLQGQLSQDVQAIAVGGAAFSLLLQPQGKIDAFIRVTRIADDAFALDVDAGWGDHVLARLRRFLLRVKVDLDLVDWPVVAVRGTDAAPSPDTGSTGAENVSWRVPPETPGVDGYDELGPGASLPDALPIIGPDEYDALRIAAGVPRMGRELDEGTIPASAGIVQRAVSFTKGCYTGQELVARIDSRGDRVPTKLRLLRAQGGAFIEPGGAVHAGGTEVGRVTSAAGGVALAYVRREVEVPADGTVGEVSVLLEPPSFLNMTRRPAVVVLLVALVLLGCAGNGKYAALKKPGKVSVAPTSSTQPSNVDDVALPRVSGTTTTAPPALGPGPVTIVGRVDGPDGPVPGARVRLERLVGDGVVGTEVPTAADGTWNLSHVLGGRYRVRAWLVPALAMAKAQLVFVEVSSSAQPVVLRVERFEGRVVSSSMAPNPPVVGHDATLAVRVANRAVDGDGVVRSVSVLGVSVSLTGAGSWSVRGSSSDHTDAEGIVRFTVACGEAGPQPLEVVLDGADTVPLDLPDCYDSTATTR